MAIAFDTEGSFRGEVVDYGLQKAKDTDSLAVVMLLRVHGFYNFETESWEDWGNIEGGPMEGYAYVWIIKKDGSPNQSAVDSLVNHAGWSGDLNEIASKAWQPNQIGFSVKAEEYKGEKQFKAAFINGYDETPRKGIRSMAPDEAKLYSTKYGANLRAMAANAKSKAAPNGKPKSPPPVGATMTTDYDDSGNRIGGDE